MFRKFRIAVLLLILACVALGTWLDRTRSTDWDKPLWVAVYPIAMDGSATVDGHIKSLSNDSFADIGEFMQREARRYNLKLSEPARVRLYGRVDTPPPALAPDAGVLSRAFFSLRLRWWASRAAGKQKGPTPDVRMFVLYHDPAAVTAVPHSMGLQKGLLGIVHAFADRDMTGSNNIVIAHEFLHTLGATDKYDANDMPAHPDGFAEPDKQPLYPQEKAEIMAGRLALSASEADMPSSLQREVIGPKTAREIGWTR